MEEAELLEGGDCIKESNGGCCVILVLLAHCHIFSFLLPNWK